MRRESSAFSQEANLIEREVVLDEKNTNDGQIESRPDCKGIEDRNKDENSTN